MRVAHDDDEVVLDARGAQREDEVGNPCRPHLVPVGQDELAVVRACLHRLLQLTRLLEITAPVVLELAQAAVGPVRVVRRHGRHRRPHAARGQLGRQLVLLQGRRPRAPRVGWLHIVRRHRRHGHDGWRRGCQLGHRRGQSRPHYSLDRQMTAPAQPFSQQLERIDALVVLGGVHRLADRPTQRLLHSGVTAKVQLVIRVCQRVVPA